jgi:hypothetical protein
VFLDTLFMGRKVFEGHVESGVGVERPDGSWRAGKEAAQADPREIARDGSHTFVCRIQGVRARG